MDQNNKQLKDALNKIRKLINKSVLEPNIKDSILVPIPIFEDKIDTHQIHVGIIGESSRDKVATLNSLLETDFFQTRDDHRDDDKNQRLVRTLIERSSEDSLDVTMLSGKVYNTKNNMLRLTKKYLPERYNSFSLVDKFKYFFGIHRDVQTNGKIVRELYNSIEEVPDVHLDVSSLRLGLSLETLPDYLVLVDTPSLGTDNQMCQRIIKETVKILCDEIIVLTPVDEPFSEKVSTFIKDNLGANPDICRVFVTGVEKIKDPEEREDKLTGIFDKAQTEFRISPRKIIGAPVALEAILRRKPNLLTPQQLDAILPGEERENLLRQYRQDLQRCFNSYNIRKETAVVEKKFSVVEDYIRFIKHLLQSTTHNNSDQIGQIQRLMVPPLQDFLRNFYSSVDVRSKTKDLCQNLVDECKGYMEEFVNSTFTLVDQAAQGKNPKDAVQGIMKDKSVMETGSRTSAKCYQSYIYKFDYAKGVYRDVFVRLESDLRKTYDITDASFKIGERLKPMSMIPYNMNVSKSGMTTFKLKRIFTSVSTIQAQMKDAIKKTCSLYFGQNAGTYSNHITQSIRAMDTEANQIRNDVLKRYKNMIDMRIANMNQRIKVLQDNNASLASLNDIVSKVIGYDVR